MKKYKYTYVQVSYYTLTENTQKTILKIKQIIIVPLIVYARNVTIM